MCVTRIPKETEQKRQDKSARCAEKHRRRARTRGTPSSDPSFSRSAPDRRCRSGRKMLVHRLDSGDLHVSRNAIWEVSAQRSKKPICAIVILQRPNIPIMLPRRRRLDFFSRGPHINTRYIHAFPHEHFALLCRVAGAYPHPETRKHCGDATGHDVGRG